MRGAPEPDAMPRCTMGCGRANLPLAAILLYKPAFRLCEHKRNARASPGGRCRSGNHQGE